MRLRSVVGAFLSCAVLACGNVVCAQGYPGKPIRILTALPGASGDFIARLLAQGIAGPLGQPVIVDNRGGFISIETVAKSPPDGYSLLVYASTLWIVPLVETVTWDAIRDFAPVTLAAKTPSIVVVHPSLPVHTIRELIAFAKARPGELNFGSSPPGSSQHLAGELFIAMAGVKFVNITYKSSGSAQIGLLSGEVHVMFPAGGSTAPHVKSGRVRALAIASAQPSALFPGLPTVSGSGLPGYEYVTITGVFAPSATPAAIISRLHQEIVRAVNQPQAKERMFNEGLEVVGGSSDELAVSIKSEVAKFSKLIKDAGIRAN